ncbi:hypothetical protein BDR07DRAFT_431220 [Suillus spraguei]|nr:hypothetical protein BDR07DRAFT_431220 [Suillus spraguei]
MKPKAELLSLPEELLTYILSFLPWQDILCCTSLCKALRRTYLSSSELQYIAELGSQQLIPVSKNHISVSKRLQLLRDNTHAWFKFDLHSFETISIPKDFHILITNGHACFWEPSKDFVRIFQYYQNPHKKPSSAISPQVRFVQFLTTAIFVYPWTQRKIYLPSLIALGMIITHLMRNPISSF